MDDPPPDERPLAPDNAPLTHSIALPEEVLEARLSAFKTELGDHLTDVVRSLYGHLLQEHRALTPLMTLADVARTLEGSPRTVEKLIEKGQLKPLWIKGQRRFHPDAVTDYIRTCERRTQRKKKSRP